MTHIDPQTPPNYFARKRDERRRAETMAQLRESEICGFRSPTGCLCGQIATVKLDGRALCSLHVQQVENIKRRKVRR